jgi:hypothetical protein
MLAVQQFLQTKTLDDLTTELGIVVKRHDTLPLAILNYDQIESPKTHPVVRECRALVLNTDTKEVAAKSFDRFFNWGEVQEEGKLFDFSDFTVQSKEDGSLVVLYHFDGCWHANTRGSFALDKMEFQNFTWREAICRALGVIDLRELDSILDPQLTYICEFCSPWNKIVRKYEKPVMYLLTAFWMYDRNAPKEADIKHCDWLAQPFDDGRSAMMRPALFQRPTMYQFKSLEEIQAFLDEQASKDATFEGVVIRDKNNQRWKIKSATYLGLHKLRGEGDNVWNPKHLLPFVLSGEEAELLTYFPEVSETFYKLKAEVQAHYIKVLEGWIEAEHGGDQKAFALSVKDSTPFASVLFNVRKSGQKPTASLFKKEWREAEGQILKRLKGA